MRWRRRRRSDGAVVTARFGLPSVGVGDLARFEAHHVHFIYPVGCVNGTVEVRLVPTHVVDDCDNIALRAQRLSVANIGIA